MDSMTLDEREKFIHDRVCEILKAFEEFKGKDISRMTIKNRDQFIQGRIASEKAVSDEILLQMRSLLKQYESHTHRSANTAALLFLVNFIDIEHIDSAMVDVVAEVEAVNNADSEGNSQ